MVEYDSYRNLVGKVEGRRILSEASRRNQTVQSLSWRGVGWLVPPPQAPSQLIAPHTAIDPAHMKT